MRALNFRQHKVTKKLKNPNRNCASSCGARLVGGREGKPSISRYITHLHGEEGGRHEARPGVDRVEVLNFGARVLHSLLGLVG